MTLARLAQRAENGFVGVQSGLMDQFAVACGRAGAALLLDCRSLDWQPVGLPLERGHPGRLRQRPGSRAGRLRLQRPAGAVRRGGGGPGRARSGGPLTAGRLERAAGRGGGRGLARAGGAPAGDPRRPRESAGDRHDGGLRGRRPGLGRRALRGQPRLASRPLRGQLAGPRRPRRDRRGDARRGRCPDDRRGLRRLHDQSRSTRRSRRPGRGDRVVVRGANRLHRAGLPGPAGGRRRPAWHA